MTDTGRIKEKIRKLFALSKSSNPGEASLALEMAQRLTAKYGIGPVSEFEITEEEVKGNGGKKPPGYEAYLISKIAGGFGCKSAYGKVNFRPKQFFGYDCDYGHVFAGLEHRVKIASFIAEVLLRKLRSARRKYIKNLKRVRLRGNKTKRADEFCLGWVYTVVSKLSEFTNSAGEQEAIDNYVAALNWTKGAKTLKREKVKNTGINDFENGRKEGAGVQIQHGMEGREDRVPLPGFSETPPSARKAV
jgi:hypothetical protein